MGSSLAIGAAAALAVGAVVRAARSRSGSPSHGEPSDQELKDWAEFLLEEACDDGVLYHVTLSENIPSIQRLGLLPLNIEESEGTFEGFMFWSSGKVFFAGGDFAKEWWQDTMGTSQKSAYKGADLSVLRVKPGMELKLPGGLYADWKSEVECSFYTTRPVPPWMLEIWIEAPGGGSWQPLAAQPDRGGSAAAPRGRGSASRVACPRCGGTGQISAFSHYAGGICFQCSGTGEVKAAAHTPQTGGEGKPSRMVLLQGLGPGLITRHGSGFQLDLNRGRSAWFDVSDGKVAVFALSDHLRRAYHERDVEQALQRVLKIGSSKT